MSYEFISSKERINLAGIEASFLKGLKNYFDKEGFTEIVVPHITKATGACENIATMFKLDYFGRKAYLSQTGQLYLEVMTPYLKKVWCTIHSFRAEPDVDNRHLTEFVLVEMEFVGDLEELIKRTEDAIYSGVRKVVDERREELEYFKVMPDLVEEMFKPSYEVITYTEAIETLKKYFPKLKWGDDLKSIHEKKITEITGKPTFVTHYPKDIKFFNMRENTEDERIVNSTDLLLPGSGEAVGGAEREPRYEKLLRRLEESTMLKMLIEEGGSREDFDWYLNFWKKYNEQNGLILHSGCGIGVSRVIQSMLQLDDIRKATVWPMNREMLY